MTFTDAPLWFTTRATGVVAFLLLTAVVALGVAATHRAVAHPRWPRFATQDLHRNLGVLALITLAVHVVTSLLDSFTDISVLTTLIPFAPASYKHDSDFRTWIALGTLATDGMLVAATTGYLRSRVSMRAWIWLHRTTYVTWFAAFLHFVTVGTDTAHAGWAWWLAWVCFAVVAAAGIVRLLNRDQSPAPVASVAR